MGTQKLMGNSLTKGKDEHMRNEERLGRGWEGQNTEKVEKKQELNNKPKKEKLALDSYLEICVRRKKAKSE